MHEFSICRTLVLQVEDAAREHHARAVTSIVVSLGPLAGIQAEELRQAFPLVSAGTMAEDAQLLIQYKPLQWRCQACGREDETDTAMASCADCGSERLQLLGGDRVMLERVEVRR